MFSQEYHPHGLKINHYDLEAISSKTAATMGIVVDRMYIPKKEGSQKHPVTQVQLSGRPVAMSSGLHPPTTGEFWEPLI